ncbi:hypothetical protein TNCV_1084531 [Trichonephila clavipes]|nr:hypothetical protein TNCV_1084531 [Trichonephila clavipes]
MRSEDQKQSKPCYVMTLGEDLKQNPVYLDSSKYSLSDSYLEIEMDIALVPNHDPQGSPKQPQLVEEKFYPCSKLVVRIVYGRDLCNAAMKYGLANEEIARKQYEREYSTEVKICGLFVDKDKPFCVLHPMDWLVMMDS